MTAPHASGERPTVRTVAPAPLITAVLAALAVAGAVALAPAPDRVPLGLGAGAGAVLLCAAVAVAAHAFGTARIARRRLEEVSQDTGRLLQDRVRQSAQFDQERVRLTEELTHERARAATEIAEERARLSAEFEQERARLTAENARLAEQARKADHERAAAVSATANAAGRMQALATGMLADLRAMEERHEDEDVLADLLHLDHRTAQAGRLADSVVVLAGARSGRRWARPISMESILRGAMGRISGYQRVRVHSASEAAVAGHAAEGVMHALAELLDNAANFSPPTAEVHVYVEEVPAGVIVSVEDSGLVMGEVQLRRAERAVTGDDTGPGGLGGTRLGLVVVGRLARKYGLKVSFRPSARGGTGVLVLVPQDILVPENPTSRPADALPLPETTAGRPKPATERPGPAGDRTKQPAGDLPRPAGDRPEPVDGHPQRSYETPHTTPDRHTTPDGVRGDDPDEVRAHDPHRAHHEPGDGEPDALSPALPKRRRGRALAQAERDRERARARAADSTDSADSSGSSGSSSAAVPLDDPLARAARFSSFRRAVRGSLSDLGEPPPDADPAPPSPEPSALSHPHPDPEGHSTS
ncbi:ATP-binding protein [Streptomyces sp. NBC_00588]|uniref:ATP-binding protein n=1 Tax=Streptomyces sp. NBC_00588 TaxID=2975784 RepID=UPI002E80A086|nr:ATP-binding protein [Streptomyces sp. NBC_00588]WUB36690.1 ATP-binding protein [Streptomyces sp. NBC_00588]